MACRFVLPALIASSVGTLLSITPTVADEGNVAIPFFAFPNPVPVAVSQVAPPPAAPGFIAEAVAPPPLAIDLENRQAVSPAEAGQESVQALPSTSPTPLPTEAGENKQTGESEATKEAADDKKVEDEGKEKEKEKDKGDEKAKEKKWYEKYTVRGYAQFRYNEVLSRDDLSAPPQVVGDRSVSEDQTFLIRRARAILSGDVSDHMALYLQADFASTPDGSTGSIHFGQIRDWYADCYVDQCKVHRFRVGQSKIPYGWENLQSSSNRIPLDRSDSLNSAARNERDLGVFYYWTPEPAQDFFTEVLDKGLKGSGNYGVFGFGAYLGQGGSFAEQNDNIHLISRFTLPMELLDGQYAEASMQGYVGNYTVLGSTIRPLGVGAAQIPLGTLDRGNRRGILDERLAWTGVWYPQPLGFQTEWNVGRGPALNAEQTEVEERALYGGYAMTMYRIDTPCRGTFFPFARWNFYRGGYKTERNAPYSRIQEWELGLEWQLNKQMELVGMYTLTDRTNTTAINQLGVVPYEQFDGDLLRFQFQVNY